MPLWRSDEVETLRSLWPDYHKAATVLGRNPVTVHGKAMRLGLPKTKDGTAVKRSGWARWMEKRKPPPPLPEALALMKKKPGAIAAGLRSPWGRTRN